MQKIMQQERKLMAVATTLLTVPCEICFKGDILKWLLQ